MYLTWDAKMVTLLKKIKATRAAVMITERICLISISFHQLFSPPPPITFFVHGNVVHSILNQVDKGEFQEFKSEIWKTFKVGEFLEQKFQNK